MLVAIWIGNIKDYLRGYDVYAVSSANMMVVSSTSTEVND